MRKRIIRLTSTVTLVAIALFGVPLAYGLSQFFLTDQHRQLQDLARNVAISVSGDSGLRQLPTAANNDPAIRFAVYDTTGTRVAGAAQEGASALLAGALKGTMRTGNLGAGYTVAVPVTDGDTVIGAVLATVSDGAVFTRIGITWGTMLVLAAVALALAWLLARRQAKELTRPLETLAAAAERLGDGDFSVHTSPVGIAEIDSVNRSVNRTATRLGSMLERERAYTADASHQLRTPLTGLRLQLEAPLEDPELDPRQAIRDALISADRLENTITDLLALARDAPRTGDALDVQALTTDLREHWHATLAGQGRPLRITNTTPLPDTNASQAAASQILNVLIDNAARHGRGAIDVTVRAAIDALAIDVTNEGPPIAGRGDGLFQRRAVTAEGHGIGLAMAARLADAEGGRLTLTAQTPTFTLLLPCRTPSASS